jgi:hypothetical protein
MRASRSGWARRRPDRIAGRTSSAARRAARLSPAIDAVVAYGPLGPVLRSHDLAAKPLPPARYRGGSTDSQHVAGQSPGAAGGPARGSLGPPPAPVRAQRATVVWYSAITRTLCGALGGQTTTFPSRPRRQVGQRLGDPERDDERKDSELDQQRPVLALARGQRQVELGGPCGRSMISTCSPGISTVPGPAFRRTQLAWKGVPHAVAPVRPH